MLTTLVTNVALSYFLIRALDEELEISRGTVGSREGSLRLVTLREQGGVAAASQV